MKLYNYIIMLLFALGFAGCARYSAYPLNRLSHKASTLEKNESISFSYKIFSRTDCKKYLDRPVIDQGYQPIQITIVNNSERYLFISKSQFTFPCVSYKEVAQTVYTSTKRRVLGYGITGLFIWPFLVPALVDGLGSSEANKKLDADFKQKSLKDQVIQPYNTATGIIFVPCESVDLEFGLALLDNNTNERFTLTTNNQLMVLYHPLKP